MSKRVRFSCHLQPEILAWIKSKAPLFGKLFGRDEALSEGAVVEHCVYSMERDHFERMGVKPGEKFMHEFKSTQEIKGEASE